MVDEEKEKASDEAAAKEKADTQQKKKSDAKEKADAEELKERTPDEAAGAEAATCPGVAATGVGSTPTATCVVANFLVGQRVSCQGNVNCQAWC